MMEKTITRETLVQEIAQALQTHYDESQAYLNLTTQEVGKWVDPALVGDDCQWPNDGDKVIRIDSLPSREAFQAMEEFADKQPERVADKLYRALSGRRPFALFKDMVDLLDLLQDWYAFKNEYYKRMAENWMHDNKVDVKDGKIVTNSKTLTWPE